MVFMGTIEANRYSLSHAPLRKGVLINIHVFLGTIETEPILSTIPGILHLREFVVISEVF